MLFFYIISGENLLVSPGREVKIRRQVSKAGVKVARHQFPLGPTRLLRPAPAGTVDAGLRRPLRLQHVAEEGRSNG